VNSIKMIFNLENKNYQKV